jgi:hypothetical protein
VNDKGDTLTTPGGTIDLASNGNGTLSTVTDNGDGTYTATITNTTAELVTVTGTIDGADITSTADVNFIPDNNNPI